MSLYFGMLLALGLYNLLLYFSLRDRIYLSYVGCALGMILAQLSMFGLGNQFLWPDSPVWGNIALPGSFCLTGYFGAMFTRQFLNTSQNSPAFDKLIRVLQGCFVLALAGTFLTGWSLLLIGVVLLALRTFNWLPTNLLTTYGMLIGSALEMLLFSFALADRIHDLRREKEDAQAEALKSERLAREALEQSEKELEARIALRTTELAEASEHSRKLASMLRLMCDNVPDMIWAKDLEQRYILAMYP